MKKIRLNSLTLFDFIPIFHNLHHTLCQNQQNSSHASDCNIYGALLELRETFPTTDGAV